MGDMRIGIKVYSLDWYWKYDLDYDQAAQELKAMGVDYVIAQSKYLPMYDSAVQSEIPASKADRMSQYRDEDFREALAQQGIAYYGACNMFFDPPTMDKHGNIPIDQHGDPMEAFDWYIGGCPTHEAYVEERIQRIEQAMQALDMDGVFLGFTRYPGFWERWLPDTIAGQWREYCFCSRCLAKFQQDKQITIPADTDLSPSQWIRRYANIAWVDFKGNVIRDIVQQVRQRVQAIRPGAQIILNTVPFDILHFGPFGREIFAQDMDKLKDVVDIFEVMGYHQILRRPYTWIAQAGEDFKRRTHKDVVCTVQAQALYLDPIYGERGRQKEITASEFGRALQGIRDAGLDGAALFTWADFLRMKYEHNDSTFIDQVKRVKFG